MSQTVVRIGNVAPLMADGSPADSDREVTIVEMREGFDDAAEVELALSTDNDQVLTLIGRGLAAADRHYAIGLAEIHQLWGVHAGDLPEWVDATDPDFARVVAAYFTTPDHECQVGEPDGWREG